MFPPSVVLSWSGRSARRRRQKRNGSAKMHNAVVRNPDGLAAFRIVEKIPDSTFFSVPDSFIVAVYLHALRRQAPQVCVFARSRYPHIRVAVVVSVDFDRRPKVRGGHIWIRTDRKQTVSSCFFAVSIPPPDVVRMILNGIFPIASDRIFIQAKYVASPKASPSSLMPRKSSSACRSTVCWSLALFS